MTKPVIRMELEPGMKCGMEGCKNLATHVETNRIEGEAFGSFAASCDQCCDCHDVMLRVFIPKLAWMAQPNILKRLLKWADKHAVSWDYDEVPTDEQLERELERK